jgi:F420-non-reducing hydrogenase large subunit
VMPEVTVDPLTRIEGLGRIRLEVEDGALKDLKFQIMVAPRFYEYLLTGKPVEEAPRISQRICGICYTSHHLVSVKAIEDAWDVEPPETAVLLRRSMNAGGFVTSHSLHNAFLALPDLVDLPANARNFVALLGKYPELGKIAVKIHAYGNKVVEATGGRVVHVVTSVPGGQTSGLSEQRRDELVEDGEETLELCTKLADFEVDLYERDLPYCEQYPRVETNFMALVNGMDYDVYDGDCRIISGDGAQLARFKPHDYLDYIEEAVWEHSSTKVPHYKPQGVESILRVGPLSRLNVSEVMPFPVAEEYLNTYLKIFPRPCTQVQAYNLARIPELIAGVEEVLMMLKDDRILSEKTRIPVKSKAGVGAAMIEAPRGTLMHNYEIDERGLLRWVNIIAPTTFNHPLIQQDLYKSASEYAHEFEDEKTRSDACWRLEKIVRAYDPCTSCSVHSLDVDLIVDGRRIEVKEGRR